MRPFSGDDPDRAGPLPRADAPSARVPGRITGDE